MYERMINIRNIYKNVHKIYDYTLIFTASYEFSLYL